MILRKWIGFVLLWLSFIALQLSYFHIHKHGSEEHLQRECSQTYQSSHIIEENCAVCDFLYLQYKNHTESDFIFSIDFIINKDELFTVDPNYLKPNKLYFNKAPPFSC